MDTDFDLAVGDRVEDQRLPKGVRRGTVVVVDPSGALIWWDNGMYTKTTSYRTHAQTFRVLDAGEEAPQHWRGYVNRWMRGENGFDIDPWLFEDLLHHATLALMVHFPSDDREAYEDCRKALQGSFQAFYTWTEWVEITRDKMSAAPIQANVPRGWTEVDA